MRSRAPKETEAWPSDQETRLSSASSAPSMGSCVCRRSLLKEQQGSAAPEEVSRGTQGRRGDKAGAPEGGSASDTDS